MDSLLKLKLFGTIKNTPAGKLVYGLMIELANEKNEIVMSQTQMARILGLSSSTVRRCIIRLNQNGYISIYHQFYDSGTTAPNKYVIK